MMRPLLIVALLLATGAAYAQMIGGMSGIGGGVGSGSAAAPVNCGTGVLDLSTGCSQLVAFGGLF